MDDEKILVSQLEDLFSDLEETVAAQSNFAVDPISDMIERQQFERQLVTFQSLVENAGEAITVSDLKGNQTYSNQAFYETFGYDYEKRELDDLPLSELWPEDQRATLTEQVIPQAKGDGWNGEVQQRRKDGSLFDAHLTAFPILNQQGWPINLAIVVHEPSASEDEIERVEEIAASASLPEELEEFQTPASIYGVGWTTLEGNAIIHTNSALYALLGADSAEDVLGKSMTNYYPPEIQERLRTEILPLAMREGQWTGELSFLSAEDEILPVVQSIFPIRDEAGKHLYLAHVVTDLTKQPHAKELLDKRVEQFNSLRDISHKVAETLPVPEFLQWVTERIPPAMQYTEVCVAAITFEGEVYGVAEAPDLSCQIVEGGRSLRPAGKIYIAYTEEHDFLDEERELLDEITRVIADYIEKRRLLEETEIMLEDLQATHQAYVPQFRPGLAPDHSGSPTGSGDGDLKSSLQNLQFLADLKERVEDSRAYEVVQERWQHVLVGLMVLAMLLLLAIMFTWMIRTQVSAKKSVQAAMANATVTATGPIATTVPGMIASPTSRISSEPSPSPSATAPTPTASVDPPTVTPSFTKTPDTKPLDIRTPDLPAKLSPTPVLLIEPAPFPGMGPGGFVPSTTLPIPTPVSPVPVASDAINIVVLGSDQRPDWSEWHTDVVQVVSVHRSEGSVSVISIPRDLYVYIPSLWMTRINFADFYGEEYGYEGGGLALVRDALLYNLGIRVDHYVRTDFDGLIEIVDALGGLDIPVHCRLSDHWPYPDENGQYPILTLEPGVHHMDGETALWYARSRKTTSVFSREQRQQQVLQALWYRMREAGMLKQIPELWVRGRDIVKTDLALPDLIDLAQVALELDERNVRFYNIGAEEVMPWTTPYGGGVYLPQWDRIRPIVAEAMAPIPKARVARAYKPVEVWNGTQKADWDLLAADRLYRAGFPAALGEPDRRDYAETQLIFFGETTKGTGVNYLQRTFGLSAAQLLHRPGDESEFDFRLIIGADYQPCPDM